MAKYCRNCNTEAPDRSKFCRLCGTPVNSQIDFEASVPATERIAPSHASPAAPVAEKDVERTPTAKTDPAILSSMRNGQSASSFAPATHALVGLFEQAGFALRFGAFMFDLLLVMLLFLVSAFLASNIPAFAEAARLGGFASAAVFCIFNFILLPARKGHTLGKRLIGIRIVSFDERRATFKQIALRHLLGYPLSFLVFALGFLWLLWDPRQQGWHDKLAGTLVVRKRLDW